MTDLLPSVILLGFFLGMRHATDPDHVIAISTIVSREPLVRNAALIGIIWGIGHSLTILVVGGVIILFGLVIPPRIGLGMEFSVGLMLIALGSATVAGRLWRIVEATADETAHTHLHRHGDSLHTHSHRHGPEGHGHRAEATLLGWCNRTFQRLGVYQTVRPFAVGVVHGLAGSAAIALLVLAMIPSPLWGILYLVVFGLGTIAGMMLVTAATALPFVYATHRLTAMNRYLAVASGVLSVGFGLFMIYRIGVVDGLFTSHPHWTPG
jgi:high-affinity nickel-transport protein